MNLAHQHGSLYGSNAKISQAIFLRVLCDSGLCFFTDKKGHQLVLHDLKNQAQVLPNQLIPVPKLIADGPEWTAPFHAEGLLQFDLSEEPRFEIVPGGDVVVDRGRTGFDRA